MSQQPFSFAMRLEDFDLGRLPIAADILRADPDLQVRAISQFYADMFKRTGGTANVAIADGTIHVSWLPKTGNARDQLLDLALQYLKENDDRAAEPLLECLHARYPDDPDILFNYGMMLSDQRQLEKAIELLERVVELNPGFSHGWTALGVAHARKGDTARSLAACQHAIDLDPSNAHAIRNTAAIIAQSSPSDAIPLYEKAVKLLPGDQPTLYGYGRCLMEVGRSGEADSIFLRCIELGPLTEIAEQARTARTKIAHQNMRGAGGDVRADVVMYMVGALQRFRELGKAKTATITAEIAFLGRNGLNINDPQATYTLKSLPGQYSGLHLVSMMYAGMKIVCPDQDAGIDLSREYEAALGLLDTEK